MMGHVSAVGNTMAGQPRGGQSWWLTLPGILTAAGTVITAITGLLVVLNQARFGGRQRLDCNAVLDCHRRESSEL